VGGIEERRDVSKGGRKPRSHSGLPPKKKGLDFKGLQREEVRGGCEARKKSPPRKKEKGGYITKSQTKGGGGIPGFDLFG